MTSIGLASGFVVTKYLYVNTVKTITEKKRNVLVRQKILDITSIIRKDGSKGCEIELDPELIRVIPTPMRPFQGWRYYMKDDIPPDLNVNVDGSDDIPDDVNSELIKLGLY